MNIAFYAPLKSPEHPHPSGDRRIARLLMQALASRGHQVELASRFRSRESSGDIGRQRRLAETGKRLAARYLRQVAKRPLAARPQLWFSYHLYYKAPDWLGPLVSRSLGIPYVVAEASFAPKRDRAPWRMVHHASGAAIASADAVVALNSDDLGCLAPLLPPGRIHRLRPFIDVSALGVSGQPDPAIRDRRRRDAAAGNALDPSQPWLVAAGMMREGDKLASYRQLADALARVRERPWQLVIIGDGDAHDQVRDAFAPMGERIHFAGLASPQALVHWFEACDLYVWPAVNEAFGMAFLEAQACGLPVVAARTRGVPDVVADGETGILVEPGAAAFAAGVGTLLDDAPLRASMGRAALDYVRREHDMQSAGERLDAILQAARSTRG